jgi:preprotein translocase subunit SecA
MKEDEPIESRMVSKAIASAQKRVEGRNFEIRKHLLEYDDVMNSQREYIYGRRDEILEGEDISYIINEYLVDVINDIAEAYSDGKKNASEWDIDGIKAYLLSKYLVDADKDGIRIESLDIHNFGNTIKEAMMKKYSGKESQIGASNMRHVERMIALQVIDSKWREHLLGMDQMRDGIWAVGYGERNPLVEYKLRGFRLFQENLFGIKQEIIEFLMKVQLREEEVQRPEPEPRKEIAPMGQAVHQEVNQFSGSQSFMEISPAVHAANKEKEQVPIKGGVQRKKTRRSRRG